MHSHYLVVHIALLRVHISSSRRSATLHRTTHAADKDEDSDADPADVIETSSLLSLLVIYTLGLCSSTAAEPLSGAIGALVFFVAVLAALARSRSRRTTTGSPRSCWRRGFRSRRP